MENFRFIVKIGSGTHGIAYLMKTKDKGELLVCKSFPRKYRHYGERECKILKTLNHPRVIQYFNTLAFDRTYYITLEYANYGNLENMIRYFKERELNIKTLISIFSQIVDGLAYIHKKEIIHRDIKPGNILFKRREGVRFLEVKISDFSLSTFYPKSGNSVVGTPYYIAPEIIRKTDYDYTVDVWSLGVSIYEAISKSKAFSGKSKLELKGEILNKEINSIPYCTDSIFEGIILSCLQREDRITSLELRRKQLIILHLNYINLKLKDMEIEYLRERCNNKP